MEDNLENEISDGDKVTSDLRDKENKLDEDEVGSIIPGSDMCTDKDEPHKKIKQLQDLIKKKKIVTQKLHLI